ncbi:MAG: hypothetical protein V2A76_10800 [Planctomycetota bacterium]
MPPEELTEPVFEAKLGALVRAREFLTQRGIASRHGRPKKAEGILRVARSQAPLARKEVAKLAGKTGRVISAEAASFWFCPDCAAPLSGGRKYCEICGFYVG